MSIAKNGVIYDEFNKILEFTEPKQVKFYDIDGDHWLGGIGIGGEIICGCCGGTMLIEDIYEGFTYTNIDNGIIVYDYWTDISNEIMGE